MRSKDTVRHPRLGEGIVKTVHFHVLTKRPTKAVVSFRRFGTHVERVCWPDDLVVVKSESSTPMPPKLSVIAGAPA